MTAGVALLMTIPQFFDIYRTAAFNTIPRDDYAPYLLALAGQGGDIPAAPYAYRAVSVAMAIPFYYLLPLYVFTNLNNPDLPYLRATQALSMVSFLSIVLTAFLIYSMARRLYGARRPAAVIAALLTFFLAGFVSRTGVDPFGILVISALFLWLREPKIFVPLMGLSVGVNEKIPIIFATIVICRLLSSMHRRRKCALFPQLAASCVAVALYFALVATLRVPGNQELFDPALLLPRLQVMLADTLSMRGLVLNGLPVLILVSMVVLASQRNREGGFQVSDVSGLLVLLILSAAAEVHYNVGRIVMYAFPLFLAGTAPLVERMLEFENPSPLDRPSPWEGEDRSNTLLEERQLGGGGARSGREAEEMHSGSRQ